MSDAINAAINGENTFELPVPHRRSEIKRLAKHNIVFDLTRGASRYKQNVALPENWTVESITREYGQMEYSIYRPKHKLFSVALSDPWSGQKSGYTFE